MKLLGLIGGVSPASTALYYRMLNEAATRRFGAAHSARLVLYSVNFAEIDQAYRAQEWRAIETIIADAAVSLRRAGAEALVICSNTTHLAAEAAAQASGLKVLHIIDALAAALNRAERRAPFLLGTDFVMDGPFYRRELKARSGLDALIPGSDDRAEITRIIFDELANGLVTSAARDRLLVMIARACASGADSVILGCTEFGLILSQAEIDAPVFETAALHVEAATNFAFGEA